LLGFSIGAALFAVPSGRTLEGRRSRGWLALAMHPLAFVMLVSAAVLCAYELHYGLAIRSWDLRHGISADGIRGYPLSLSLIWAIMGIAVITLGSWRRALFGVALLTLPFFLMAWVPWQFLHWPRFAAALLLADTLRTRGVVSFGATRS
jgi:hypothetical protein